jgi:DNA-binding NarL/FixJ family response regulator
MGKTLIIAEQSEIIRKGLVYLTESMGIFSVIREISCPSGLHESINRYQPHIIILNPSFILPEGLDELRELVEKHQLRIAAIVYSLYDDDFLLRFDDVIRISDTRQKMQKRLNDLIDKGPEKAPQKRDETLSARELDVLKLLVKGMSNKEISDKLFISTHTVISHRKNITQKLNIKSVAGLTVYAILNELISMDDVQ